VEAAELTTGWCSSRIWAAGETENEFGTTTLHTWFVVLSAWIAGNGNPFSS
jgi:hypothetical protein